MKHGLPGVSLAAAAPIFEHFLMKHFACSFVLLAEGNEQLMWRNGPNMTNVHKLPPVLEDLRNHTPEQVAELRLLIASDAPSRPDPRRPGFFEVQGSESVYYVFRYPNGSKVLLLGVWERDRVAELVACSCPAA